MYHAIDSDFDDLFTESDRLTERGELEIYAEGHAAQCRGESRDTCPYTEGSDAEEAWLEGWDWAEEQDLG